MRELDSRRLPSRVRGRAALERSLRAMVIRVRRFGEHRARTAHDRLWAAAIIDALHELTPSVPSVPSGPGVPRRVWEGEARRTDDRSTT